MTQYLSSIQAYQVFVKDFTSLLPFLTIFLDNNHHNLKRECLQPSQGNECLCKDVQALFTSLSDIYQCWLMSQHFKREFQTHMHQFWQQMRLHGNLVWKSEQLSPGSLKQRQVAGPCSKQEPRRKMNVILMCLELLLPVVERLIPSEDRTLVDMCASKLGMVCTYIYN